MGSKVDYRCRPALAHLLQMATRQAMQTSRVRDPPFMQPVLPSARRAKGVDPEEESFFSSEGDVSLLPDADHVTSQPLLFSDLYRSCYTQCSERQVLMGKVFEQVVSPWSLSPSLLAINVSHMHLPRFVFVTVCQLSAPSRILRSVSDTLSLQIPGTGHSTVGSRAYAVFGPCTRNGLQLSLRSKPILNLK